MRGFRLLLVLLFSYTGLAAEFEQRWQVLFGVVRDHDTYRFNPRVDLVQDRFLGNFSDYQGGFVREDESGNIDGRTGYWGYEDESQVTARPDYVRYRQYTGVALSAELQHLQQKLRREGITVTVRGFLDAEQRWTLGFGGYMASGSRFFSQGFDYTLSGKTLDHPLNGVVPPPAPYEGSYTLQPGMPRLVATPETQFFMERPGPQQDWTGSIRSSVMDFNLSLTGRILQLGRFGLSGRGGLGIERHDLRIELQQRTVFEGNVVQEEELVYENRARTDAYIFAGLEADFRFDQEHNWSLGLAVDQRWGRSNRSYLGHIEQKRSPYRFQLTLRRDF